MGHIKGGGSKVCKRGFIVRRSRKAKALKCRQHLKEDGLSDE
jgi:hypothetical protein